MMEAIQRFVRDTRGATAIEYGLIAGFVSIAMFVAMTLIGTKLNTKLTNISNKLN